MKHSILCIFATALWLSTTPAQVHAKKPMKKKMPKPYQEMRFREARFKCEVPAAWNAIPRDKAAEKRTKTYDVALHGPQNSHTPPPTITLTYFSGASTDYSGSKQYIDHFQKPSIYALPGDKTSKPAMITVAGRSGHHFKHHTSTRFPKKSSEAETVKILQEHIVLDHEEGFFVLRFECPKSDLDRWRPVFQHVIDTFRPIDAKKKSE